MYLTGWYEYEVSVEGQKIWFQYDKNVENCDIWIEVSYIFEQY